MTNGIDGAEVRLVGVRKRYVLPTGPVDALSRVEASFQPGCLNVVAGPSGAGKSTLLRLVALLEPPSAGRVIIGGADTSGWTQRARRRFRRTAIAYVFQRPTDNLADALDVAGQIRLAAQLAGRSAADPVEILTALGMHPKMHANPFQLSGGEQQRTALAAALAANARLIVVDEPTSQLDDHAGAMVRSALLHLARRGATVVVGTHDDALIGPAHHVTVLQTGSTTLPESR